MFGDFFDLSTGSLGSLGSDNQANPLPRLQEQHLPEGAREILQNLPFTQPRG